MRTASRGPLNNPDFGALASNLFGLDSGALIGLEYRYGLMRGLQAGIYRTSGKTIQFFGQYDAVRQSATVPFTLNVVASIEGLNNFHRGDVVDEEDNEYATALGGLLSRTIGDRAAFTYSTAGCLEHIEHGHDIPGCLDATTVGIEKRLRGHVFHLNVSNREVLLSSADLQVGVSSPSPTDRESRRPRSPWCAR